MQEVSIEKKYFCSMRSGSGICAELYGLYEPEKNIPFEIQAFTTVENLITYGKQTHIELLLISGRAMCREIRELDIGKVIILSEGVHPPELDQYPSVYKYQSSSDVLRK